MRRWLLGMVCVFSLVCEAQTIPTITLDALYKRVRTGADTTYVVNFFATWCAPCLKEMPDLIQFAAIQQGQKVALLLVSLDMEKEYATELPPMMAQFGIQRGVYWLDEPDANAWITRVDKAWEGGIPATLILRHHRKYRKFMAEPVTVDELISFLP